MSLGARKLKCINKIVKTGQANLCMREMNLSLNNDYSTQDTKRVIRNRKSKDRQQNGQKQKEKKKRQKMDYKTLYGKIEIEAHELHKTPGLSHSLLMVNQLLLHQWHPSCYCYTTRTSFEIVIVVNTSRRIITDIFCSSKNVIIEKFYFNISQLILFYNSLLFPFDIKSFL